MSRAALALLVERVSHDDELLARVVGIRDRDEFCTEVIAIAAAEGLPVAREDVVDGLREARTAWLARWV
ncbi:MAG: hypothetical protein ACJ735_17600 [Actinomycetes bacterium]